MPYVADCNNAHTLADIRRDEKRWAAANLLFFEDPYGRPRICCTAPAMPGITIGMGADFGSAEQMAVYTKAPAIGVLQPDVCMLGGLSEAKRALAMLAAAKKTAGASHAVRRPGGARLAAHAGGHRRGGLFRHRRGRGSMDPYGFGLTRWQGSLEVPTGPGLGFDPDPGFLRRYDCAKE